MTEQKLRESIRQAIRLVKKKRVITEEKIKLDEAKLRAAIRKFANIEFKLMNEAGTPDNDPAPHGNTGINVLEDLLKKIIPILEKTIDYVKQRGSKNIQFLFSFYQIEIS